MDQRFNEEARRRMSRFNRHLEAIAAEHIEALGFEQDVMKWQISRCSSGEKQRLSILRLLSNCPRVLLLDEPTANLDAGNAVRVEELVHHYLTTHNSTAIWVGHDASQLQRVSQSQYHLSDGKLVKVDKQ